MDCFDIARGSSALRGLKFEHACRFLVAEPGGPVAGRRRWRDGPCRESKRDSWQQVVDNHA